MKFYRALLLALLISVGLPGHAFAQKTKSALTTEIGTNWPDNSIGSITPAILRSTVIDIVNSYYDLNGGTSLSCAAHQWISGLPTLSSITCTQPAFTDISGQITLVQLPTIGANTALCSIAGGTPIACNTTQLTTLINLATSSLSGAVPAFPNNTTTFLRGDLTYATLNFAALGGQATLAQLPTGVSDTALGYWGSTVASAASIPNCASALIYSTSTHTWGCSTGAGTGTVTSVTCFGTAITTSGTCVAAAAKADEQAGTSATLATTPSQQQQHDSAAKAWVNFTGSGTNGAQTVNASYNVSGVSRTAAGAYTVSFTTAFATTSYSCHAQWEANATANGLAEINVRSTGNVTLSFLTSFSTNGDPPFGDVVCFGRQ